MCICVYTGRGADGKVSRFHYSEAPLLEVRGVMSSLMCCVVCRRRGVLLPCTTSVCQHFSLRPSDCEAAHADRARPLSYHTRVGIFQVWVE
jgi:hypothetical protein